MKKAITILLIVLLVLTLLTGCVKTIETDSSDGTDEDLDNAAIADLDTEFLDETDTVELGELV
jgi:hypothetical protein